MNRLIKRFDSAKDQDLRICAHRGIAFQRDMKADAVAYDDGYHDHYKALEGTAVAEKLNAGRVAMVARHATEGAAVLDIGAGCGTFVRAARAWGFDAKGFDIIPKTVEHLKAIDAFADNPDGFEVITFWDSLEHIEEPETVLKRVNRGAVVVAAIPVFEDLNRIRESKHYKPGEHLYYFTPQGFIDWMGLYGFRLLEQSSHETDAGREAIGAFAFCRDLPDYHDHIAAYAEMHSTRFYGSSATELHLATVAKAVKELKPSSILDWGCGRSDLVAHFWADGARHIDRYDPAIPKFKTKPAGTFALVLCCDVMEHIPMASVDRVLDEIREKGKCVLFTISTKPARAKLPDGRNAHVTLLTRGEWTRWIADTFGPVRELPSAFEHELVLLAGSQ